MQAPVHPVDSVLRDIAAEARGTEAICARTVALWTGVAHALVPIIGQRGMSALYERALHLASAQHKWLEQARGADADDGFSLLAAAASNQSQDDAIAAITLLFETFDRVLVTLIGASLTVRLLQPVWDVPSASPTRQDTAP